mgnify:FL=1
MMRLGLNRGQAARKADDGRNYLETLAVWQLRHGADHHDLTPSQRARFVVHNRCLDTGLDPRRLMFVRLLMRMGRIHD